MIHLFLILYITELVLCDFKVLLLHTNDMHARFKEVGRHLERCDDKSSLSCYGGFARLYSMVKRKKQEAEERGIPSLFLNAGDNFQGTPYYNFFKWKIVGKMMDVLGADVMNLGNHEFDDGVPGLAPYINNVSVPVVCCNLDLSEEPAMRVANLTPSKVFLIDNTKVGVIGYLTHHMSKSGMGRIKILNEIPSVRAEARRLLKQGVKILIALGHSGYERDLVIAREVEEIDVVVGGHSHTFLFTGTPPDVEQPEGPYPTVVTQASGKKVPVVQAFYGTKYLGCLELDFDDNGDLKSFVGSPILLSGNLPEDGKVLKILAQYDSKKSETTRRIIGYTHVLLDNTGLKCRMFECNIGNMITDAYVDHVAKHCQTTEGWTTASVGITNAQGIRASIDRISAGRNGSVTLEDVMTSLPFGDHLVVLRLPGGVLVDVLEHSVSRYEHAATTHDTAFLQVSGLRVTYLTNRKPGHRVGSVKVLCADCQVPSFEPLSLDKVYGVVLPEFLAKGNDGYTMLTNHTGVCKTTDVDYAIVAKYIENHSPVNARVENRIVITRDDNTVLLVVVTFFVVCYLYLLFNSIVKSNMRLKYFILRTEEY